jgi:transposase-like protein
MNANAIHFQPGMSITAFVRDFGSEAQCFQALKAARWPDGFRCPSCGSGQHCEVRQGGRTLFQCSACRHQASVTAGSLMEHTKLPLKTWFLAIYLISQAKTGLSALALKRQLGVSYPTAWLLHHKINQAMAHRDAQHRLTGTIQLDDAYLGGERAGKPGRGSENKVPFVAAVAVDHRGHPRYLKLSTLTGFTREAVAKWAAGSLAAGTVVRSDGLNCFAAVTDAGCVHQPRVVGCLKPRDLPEFKWVNTVLGNLKTTLSGAFHALKYRKYADRYLAAFAYRFNRRFDLRDLVVRLIVDVARHKPFKESLVREHAEARF